MAPHDNDAPGRSEADLVELSQTPLTARFIAENPEHILALLAYIVDAYRGFSPPGIVLIPDGFGSHAGKGRLLHGYDRKHANTILRYELESSSS